jgi:hypothetical protein
MSFLDKVKKGAGQAAAKAKDEVSELQAKNELVKTYELLGKKTFELVDKGDISHAELEEAVTKIRDLRAKLEDLALGSEPEQESTS